MSIVDYIIVGIIAVWFVAAVWIMIRRKKQGKSMCGCGGSCSGCSAGSKNAAVKESGCSGNCKSCPGCGKMKGK